MPRLTRAALRRLACAAVRSKIRATGKNPEDATDEEVDAVLDDLGRTAPDTLAGRYARLDPDAKEWRRFLKEWRVQLIRAGYFRWLRR